MLLVLGLIAVVPSPNDWVWLLGVLVTEGGHWALVACLPLFAPGWRRTRLSRAGVGLGLLGTLLLLTPLARAVAFSRELPGALETRFAVLGSMTPVVFPRPASLVVRSLFIGVSSPAVRVEDHLFASIDGQELRLDLYRPAEDHAPLPGVIVIHGGSWQSGSRKDFPALNRYLAARGYVVAAVSYRFAPRFRFPAARDDVAAAITFLKRNAERLGLDASRLALVGRSAGSSRWSWPIRHATRPSGASCPTTGRRRCDGVTPTRQSGRSSTRAAFSTRIWADHPRPTGRNMMRHLR